MLVDGLNRAGWPVEKPKATMFVWAPIPEPFRAMGSLEFAKFLLREAKVAVSPGVGFGADGDGFVRFALIENEHRSRQAIRGIRHALRAGTPAFPASAQPRLLSAIAMASGESLKPVRLALLGCGTVGERRRAAAAHATPRCSNASSARRWNWPASPIAVSSPIPALGITRS